MAPESRRLSIRRPILSYSLLLAFLLATVAGLTAPAPSSADSPKANKVFTPATVPIVSNPVLDAAATKLASRARLRESYGKLPLSFEANQGQTDSSVKFLSRATNDDDGRPKRHFAVQLALYTDILERLGYSAGRTPFVWDINGKRIPYDLMEMRGTRNHL